MRLSTSRCLSLIALPALFLVSSPVASLAVTRGTFVVSWTDRLGNPHPLASTQISVYAPTASGEAFVGGWITDANGRATFTTNYAPPDGGPLQLVVSVNATVNLAGTASNTFGGTPFAVRLPGTYAFNFNSSGTTYTPPPVANTSDGGKAIGFMQGLKVASDHFRSLGANVPYANVRYAPQWGNGSSMNGQFLTLGYNAWGAWDEALHEFGHGIANLNDLHTQPTIGASHSFNQDNISAGPMLGPAAGTQFAWQEGIATYLGTSALRNRLPAAFPGAAVADSNTSYDRFASTSSTTPDSSAQFIVNLEDRTGVVSGTNFFIPGKGEGEELSVARILWDLEDDTPAESLPRAGRTDRISLGAQAVYDLMKSAVTQGGSGGRLASLWRVAREAYGTTPESRALLGDLFEASAVSAIPATGFGVRDGDTTSSQTPFLSWTEQNSGHSDLFQVAVFSDDWSTLVQLSPQLNGQTFWQPTSPLGHGTYHWVVLCNSAVQSAISFDDSYWSGAATFTVIPEPGTVALALAPVLATLLARRRRGE